MPFCFNLRIFKLRCTFYIAVIVGTTWFTCLILVFLTLFIALSIGNCFLQCYYGWPLCNHLKHCIFYNIFIIWRKLFIAMPTPLIEWRSFLCSMFSNNLLGVFVYYHEGSLYAIGIPVISCSEVVLSVYFQFFILISNFPKIMYERYLSSVSLLNSSF